MFFEGLRSISWPVESCFHREVEAVESSVSHCPQQETITACNPLYNHNILFLQFRFLRNKQDVNTTKGKRIHLRA